MRHRRVVAGSEHEAEAELVDALADLRGAQLDVDAECLEQFGGAARAVRAVAMLGDGAARAGRNQRRRGRDVEGRGPAAGASRVDEILARGLDRGGERAHRPRQPDQL
jgi:hypothetical protein